MSDRRVVAKFNQDAKVGRGYVYTSADRLSARLSAERLTLAVREMIDLKGKRVIDIGCGDGTYTIELLGGLPEYVLGIDPAEMAIGCARSRAAGLDGVEFRVSDLSDLSRLDRKFDVAVVRGVLHHLPDVEAAIAGVCAVADEIVVVEPNGYNPVLQIIEKISPYHIEHEEKSYFPHHLDRWFRAHGGEVVRSGFCGLVPMYCPDSVARMLKALEPVVENVPVLRRVLSGSYIQKIRLST